MPDESAESGTDTSTEAPAATTPAPGTVNATAPDLKAYTPEQINAIVENRLARERARFADYGDLKRKAQDYDKLVESTKTEQERAVEEARRAGYGEAQSKANGRLVRAEARATAASLRFRDPGDAVAFLSDLDSVAVSDDGAVDTDALAARLNELAKAKPYLLAEDKPTRPSGDAGQGPRNNTGPTNMNEVLRSLGRH